MPFVDLFGFFIQHTAQHIDPFSGPVLVLFKMALKNLYLLAAQNITLFTLLPCSFVVLGALEKRLCVVHFDRCSLNALSVHLLLLLGRGNELLTVKRIAIVRQHLLRQTILSPNFFERILLSLSALWCIKGFSVL